MKAGYRFFEDAHWLRILQMVVYWLILPFVTFAIGVIAIIQTVCALVNSEPLTRASRIGGQLIAFLRQICDFLIYKTDEKPFPYSDWPKE